MVEKNGSRLVESAGTVPLSGLVSEAMPSRPQA
jgi:hypothetical protein